MLRYSRRRGKTAPRNLEKNGILRSCPNCKKMLSHTLDKAIVNAHFPSRPHVSGIADKPGLHHGRNQGSCFTNRLTASLDGMTPPSHATHRSHRALPAEMPPSSPAGLETWRRPPRPPAACLPWSGPRRRPRRRPRLPAALVPSRPPPAPPLACAAAPEGRRVCHDTVRCRCRE